MLRGIRARCLELDDLETGQWRKCEAALAGARRLRLAVKHDRSGIRCVAEEQPWHMELEALVSPHANPDHVWLHDRQGPAQLAQDVVYRFYRRK